MLASCVLKIASRCNMKCTYCYMYELADQTWMNQPKIMSQAVIAGFLERLDEYFNNYIGNNFLVVIHGGEPLLAGVPIMEQLFSSITKIGHKRGVSVGFTVQTNSLLLNEEWINLFRKYNCIVGISLDGPSYVNDKRRKLHNGNATAHIVERKIKLLQQEAEDIFSGCLAVIDPTVQGAKIVDYFHDLGVKKLDFLLPDQNYVIQSPHYPSATDNISVYTEFLANAYIRWREIDDPDYDIRFFRELVMAVFGKSPSLDSLGTNDANIFVIETDGGMEPLDTFKCCGEDFTKLGLNVLDNSITEFEENQSVKSLVQKSMNIPLNCSQCRYLGMCGGGYMPHRFNGIDFRSPSVYCDALFNICATIEADIKKAILTS
ncbi:radical SAM protein [Taibaiella soli]|uniref:Radical SAM core domain-containing protein n=1 Tax=Taibaiella soli TaxID=1649169 RepID=A0A2W2BCG3_9BACT|nr:radical SAM protein [Taibaiella soli]PZF73567.1 hypothetical protein DN068_07545 [Taibaiella soli]